MNIIFLSCLAIISLFVVENCFGFQVNPSSKESVMFKDAIEKTVKKKIDPEPITVIDDNNFSPKIPSLPIHIRNRHRAPQMSKTMSNADTSPSFPIALPLSESLCTKMNIPFTRNATARKRYGLDEYPAEYWFHNKIHTFGNTGILGGLHAAVAPLATKMIDNSAYDGHSVRDSIAKRLCKRVQSKGARVIDLCCGVGISTRAIQAEFQDAEVVVGVDTSPEMISMAKFLTRHETQIEKTRDFLREKVNLLLSSMQLPSEKNVSIPRMGSAGLDRKLEALYALGNAERTKFPAQSFDLATIMYAFHEAPYTGRYRMLREVRRLLRNGGTLAVVDISPEYEPSPTMLAGEPYVLEYKENIMKQMESIQGFSDVEYHVVVPGHVGMWLLTRDRA